MVDSRTRADYEPLRGDPAIAPLVALYQVDVTLEGHKVLHDIDWQLRAGEHWGIVGGNGSGKSTLLKLAGGALWPAPGRGRRLYGLGHGIETDAVRARRSFVLVADELQDRYARFGWNFTALEVVLSGLFRTDVPRRRASSADTDRALALLSELGLAAFAPRRFLELSRGEQRRVLIARALGFQPRVLLLDEPASGLDDRARRRLHAMIDRVALRVTVVCAEHRVEDLPRPITQVLTLDGGRIRYRGPVCDLPRTDRRLARGKKIASVPATATTTTAPLIRIESAELWRGPRLVLRDVNWDLMPGQHWLVRGANGAGKSSFLRLLYGQLRPARGGRISWPALGDPRNIWALRRLVGWLSPELQAGYRYPSTVRACIASGFDSSIGLTRTLTALEEDRVDHLLARFELEPLAGRALSGLSYGQFKRALICRSMATRPRVLLLDEPWEGLDFATAELLNDELVALAADGVQLVCASHLSRYAQWFAPLFTHMLELAGGRISYTGPNPLRHDDADGALREN
jgi:molybdate transport system ATP-binding protein